MNMNMILNNPNVNRQIIQKLKEYPEDISELSIAAVSLSENLPEMTVFEQLQTLVRQIVRKRGDSIDTA